jgi:hypothetical protein
MTTTKPHCQYLNWMPLIMKPSVQPAAITAPEKPLELMNELYEHNHNGFR